MPENNRAGDRSDFHALVAWHPGVLSVAGAPADRAHDRPRAPAARRRALRPLALRLLALGLLAALFACGPSAPPVAVTVGEICAQEAGTTVTAQGYLALPVSALICAGGQCKISFYDEGGSVPVEFVTSRQPDPGKLTLPPDPYTADDLEVTLAGGARADRTTLVRITGPVRKPSASSCYLDAHVTAAP